MINWLGHWLEDDTHRLLAILGVVIAGAILDVTVWTAPYGQIAAIAVLLPLVAFWTWWRMRA